MTNNQQQHQQQQRPVPSSLSPSSIIAAVTDKIECSLFLPSSDESTKRRAKSRISLLQNKNPLNGNIPNQAATMSSSDCSEKVDCNEHLPNPKQSAQQCIRNNSSLNHNSNDNNRCEEKVPPTQQPILKTSAAVQVGGQTHRGNGIQNQLLRARDMKTDFDRIYTIIQEIGHGGLCKIYKIQKNRDQIGGSSRKSNQRKHKLLNPFGVSCTPWSSSMYKSSSSHSLSPKINRLHHFREGLVSSSSMPTIPQMNPSDSYDKLNVAFDTATNRTPMSASSAIVGGEDTNDLSLCNQKPMYFALKVINLALVQEDKIDQLKNEVEILKALDHPNILRAYETFQQGPTKNIQIVMELCTGGNLLARIPYTEQQAATITKQILSAVSYMHARSIIHRDIKLENVVFESESPMAAIRVIDFGLSKVYSSTNDSPSVSDRVGTLYSMSPETLKGNYSYKADLWSIGVCLYMMLANGRQPFEGKTPKQLISNILAVRFDFHDDLWSDITNDAITFISKLLVKEADKRLSADEAMQDNWILMYGRRQVTQQVATTGTTTIKTQHDDDKLKERVKQCMVRYSQYNDFMKLAMNAIAKKSTADEIFDLRRVFEEFDTLNTGTLTFPEFRAALSQFNYPAEDIARMFHKIDINKTNEINYTEFLAATLDSKGRIEEHRLAEAFDLIDSDDSGYISRENLRQILGNDDAYIDRLVNQMGLNKKDSSSKRIKISYSDFLRFFENEQKRIMYQFYEESSTEFIAPLPPSSSSSSLSLSNVTMNDTLNAINEHSTVKFAVVEKDGET